MSRVAPDATCKALDIGLPEANLDMNGWLNWISKASVKSRVYDVVTFFPVYDVVTIVSYQAG
jgi:hypothetical protein